VDSTSKPRFSIVIPFYNEEGSLGPLLSELRPILDLIGEPYELVLLNDGSVDSTGTKLDQVAADWSACRVIHQRKNLGQATALWNGFQAARGQWIITMDGDGQNVPADIPTLISLSHDHDMVVGIRANRHDNWSRKVMSRVANAVRRRILRDRLTDSGCALKVFRREVISSFLPMRSLYSFMPTFAAIAGFRIAEIAVQHRARKAGMSHYGFGTFAWKPAMDMLTIWWFSRRRLPLNDL
jgi:dolichol-phosphate mannosyltransferase